MHRDEFVALAFKVVYRLTPLLDREEAETVRHLARTGAGTGVLHSHAIPTLVSFLAGAGATITRTDRDDLDRLLTYLRSSNGEPAWLETAFQRLQVEPARRRWWRSR